MYSSFPPSTSEPTFTTTPRPVPESFATRRPWREFTDMYCFAGPSSLREANNRIKHNLGYFRVNYSAVILLILFLGLLWHPYSMITFLVILVAWGFFYFSRVQPFVFFQYTIDDRVVLGVLAFVTFMAFIRSDVWLNVLISLSAGLSTVLIHASFRRTEDLYSQYLEGGLFTAVGSSFPKAGMGIPLIPVVNPDSVDGFVEGQV